MTDSNGSGTGMTVKELVLEVRQTLNDYVEKHDMLHAEEYRSRREMSDQIQRWRGATATAAFLGGAGLLVVIARIAGLLP